MVVKISYLFIFQYYKDNNFYLTMLIFYHFSYIELTLINTLIGFTLYFQFHLYLFAGFHPNYSCFFTYWRI